MLPKIFLKDIRLMALSDIAKDELESLRGAIRFLQIHDIDNVHPSFLPFLAYIYRADAWDDNWPTEHQREVVKEALVLFTLKGTIWAVERALELSGFESVLTPWYDMEPLGERGTFRVSVFPMLNSDSFIKVDYERIFDLVESNKQGSQVWTGEVNNQINGDMFAAFAVVGRRRYIVRGNT